MITISEYELRGELALSKGIGFFLITLYDAGCVMKSFDPFSATLELQGETINSAPLALQYGESIDLVKLSILTINEQAKHYQPSHYEALLDEAFELNSGHLQRGSILMKQAVEASLSGVSSRLLEAAAISAEALCDEYLQIIKEAHPDDDLERRFLDVSKLVKPDLIKPDPTVVETSLPADIDLETREYLREIRLRECRSDALFSQWFTYFIKAQWLGRIDFLAQHIPAIRSPAAALILSSQRERPEMMPLTLTQGASCQVWLEAEGQLTAGLTPRAVERVLQIHDKAIVLDIVKLLVMLWTESINVKLSNRYTIEGRYKGLQDMLIERFGISSKSKRGLTQIVDACDFLNRLRVGLGQQEGKSSFFSFDIRYNALCVSYLPAFTDPLLSRTERLVPILNHPRGHTKSRASYNRLGLAIGLLLVNESVPNHFGGGGVPLNDQTLRWLRREAGFSRAEALKKALKAFEDDGAITITHNHMRLGAKNIDAANLIESGARRQISGSRGGLKAQRKKLRFS